jgi:hypothetical protein
MTCTRDHLSPICLPKPFAVHTPVIGIYKEIICQIVLMMYQLFIWQGLVTGLVPVTKARILTHLEPLKELLGFLGKKCNRFDNSCSGL